jgi:hypothetical protein
VRAVPDSTELNHEGSLSSPAVPAVTAAKRRVRWHKPLSALAGVSILVWVLVAKGGARVVRDVIENIGHAWPLLLVPFACNALVTVLGYRTALPGRGKAIPLSAMIHAERSGAVLSSLLPLGNSGGNIAKLLLLRHWYLTEEIVAAGVWAGLATGLCHSLGAAGPLIAAAIGAVPVSKAAFVLAASNLAMALPAMLVMLSVRRGLCERVVRLLAYVPFEIIVDARRTRIEAWAARLDKHLAAAVGPRRKDFLSLLGYKALAQAIRIAEIWLAVELLNLPGGLATAVLYNALSRAMTLLFSFVPGQLGVLELSSMVGFKSLGFEPEMGLSLALVLRFRYVVNMALSASALGTSAKLLQRFPARKDSEITAAREPSKVPSVLG